MMRHLQKGFSLIEILVAIAIIGMLAAVVFGGFNLVREKARDARRIQDIQSIQKALELYMVAHDTFPISTATTTLTGEDSISTALTDNEAIVSTPLDPLHPTHSYSYSSNAIGNNYLLSFCLETESLAGYAQGCGNTVSP